MDEPRDIGQRIRAAAARSHPDLAGVVGSYRWDVEGKGSWYVSIDHGVATAREGMLSADCIIASNEDDFWAVIEGRQNLLTALMQGRVRIEGDLALAQKLHGLLPGPQNVPATPAGVV